MNEHARRTPDMRVGPTPGARGAHAGHSLYVRRLRSSEHVAHISRTRSAHRAHTQRVSNACSEMRARAIRSAR